MFDSQYWLNVNTLGALFLGARLLYLAILEGASKDNTSQEPPAIMKSKQTKSSIDDCIREILKFACILESTETTVEVAVSRIAWPMFLCALESGDPVYQSWIIHHFAELKSRKVNFQKAFQVMRENKGRGIMNFVRSSHFGTFVI
jgi:Fungal specific transcription factor domain